MTSICEIKNWQKYDLFICRTNFFKVFHNFTKSEKFCNQWESMGFCKLIDAFMSKIAMILFEKPHHEFFVF